MSSYKDLSAIFDRITNGQETEGDMQTLRQLLRARDGQNIVQVGSNIVNIAEGRDIQIGDRTYYDTDAEAIKQALRAVLQEKRKAERPRNERLLLQAVKDEVVTRLKQSLHNAVLINLGKEAQPEQVKYPWSSDIKIGDKPSEPIPATTSILEVFDQEEIAGRLLILGNPGVGKTTTMLDLAKSLIARAEEEADYPIPVLFNLSAWKDDKQWMHDWLVVELKSKYGVRQDIGTKWVDNVKLLPMLDGLDELESVRQELCVQKINELLQSDCRPQYLVVCSRAEEYGNYTSKLHVNGAICLRELNDAQIQEYLTAVGRQDLQQALRQDSTMLELMRKPLLLSIAVLSAQELLVEDWQRLSSTEARVEYLLNVYVRRMLTRDIKNLSYAQSMEPDPKQTLRWLSWLAQKLEDQNMTEFLIEKMQPDFLQPKSEKFYYFVIWQISAIGLKLLSRVIETVVSGCEEILHLERNEIDEQISLIINIPFLISIIPFAVSLPVFSLRTIRPVETLKLPFKYLHKEIKIGFISYLILGFIMEIFPLNNHTDNNASGLKTWAIVLANYTFFLNRRLILKSNQMIGPELETREFSNQGIRQSAINAMTTGFIGSLTGIMIGGIWGILSSNDTTMIIILGIRSVYMGLIYALIFGGYACIQHFFLRLALLQEDAIPWNYARFLDYCTERLFLQRVGGRYRFIHRLLQEHFAGMPLEGVGNIKTN